MVWTGAGLHGLMLAFFLVMSLIGIDPDKSGVKFFLVLAPFLFLFGIILTNISNRLHVIWQTEEKGWGYKLNRVFSFLLCDFSAPPTVFFIPLPFLSIVSLIISLVIWAGIFK